MNYVISNRGNLLILLSSLMIIMFYLTDAIINRHFNLHIASFIFIPTLLLMNLRFNFRTNSFQVSVILSFLVLTSFQVLFNHVCFNWKSVISILFAIIILINGSKIKKLFEQVLLNHSHFLLVIILSSVLLILVNIHIHGIFFGINKFGGFYNEPSHLALYGSPIIAYRLLNNKFDPLSLISIVAIISLANSFLFLIFLLILFSILYPKLSFLTLSISVLVVFILIIFGSDIISQLGSVTYQENKIIGRYADRIRGLFYLDNLTSLVYLHGVNLAHENLFLGKYVGLGFNNMGCYINEIPVSHYEDKISKIINDDKRVHHQDGSFLASKIVSDFGVFGIFLLFYFMTRFIIIFREAIFNLRKENVFLIAASITFFLSLFFRSTSYFTAFNIFCFCSFMYTQKIKKDFVAE